MQVQSRSFSPSFVQSTLAKSTLTKVKKDSLRPVVTKPIIAKPIITKSMSVSVVSVSASLFAGLGILCSPLAAAASDENVLSHEQSVALIEAQSLEVQPSETQSSETDVQLAVESFSEGLSSTGLSKMRSVERADRGAAASPRTQRPQTRQSRTRQSPHQSSQAKPKQPRRIRFQPGTPPPDRGTPRAPYGTGSRGSCLQNAEMPPLIQLSGSRGLDLTVSEHPSFWVYVPYSQGDVSTARFSLQKENTEVYQQSIQLPTTPGIVEIAMPNSLPALEAGSTYRWYFEIGCPQVDPSKEPVPATVTGVVQRVASSEALESDLEEAQSPLEEVEAYANNHIWHETLSSLAQLRQSDPMNQNLAEIWQSMLSDPHIGLENWANLPIVGEAIAIRTEQP